MLNYKNKLLILSVSFILLILISLCIYLHFSSKTSDINCASNVEISNRNYKFSGSIIYDFGETAGTVTLSGKILDNDKHFGNVTRRVRVNLERNNNTIIITSTAISQAPEDVIPYEIARMVMPAYSSQTGLSSTYVVYRQLSGSYIMMRGTILLMYCNT